MFLDPWSVFDFWGKVFEAHFTQAEPDKKKEPDLPMKVIWEIGPGGYQCGRCVPG